ncbi:hypothetical protein CDAR_620101 [Caerostris darwini]|uniref:Uncharacterized protein n=1 Tax=Caerostris darwini TaxID=1538125 RepID=A0AAV4TST1_9ARAC|nr:hypothetical protein CDAR_620101 [Caerostris darwini]
MNPDSRRPGSPLPIFELLERVDLNSASSLDSSASVFVRNVQSPTMASGQSDPSNNGKPETKTSSSKSSSKSSTPENLADLSVRSECIALLTLKRNTFFKMKDLEDKLNVIKPSMDAVMKSAINICKKIEEILERNTETEVELKTENDRLMYLIGMMTIFFKKINTFAMSLRQTIVSYTDLMDDSNTKMDEQLIRIIEVMCAKCEYENEIC